MIWLQGWTVSARGNSHWSFLRKKTFLHSTDRTIGWLLYPIKRSYQQEAFPFIFLGGWWRKRRLAGSLIRGHSNLWPQWWRVAGQMEESWFTNNVCSWMCRWWCLLYCQDFRIQTFNTIVISDHNFRILPSYVIGPSSHYDLRFPVFPVQTVFLQVSALISKAKINCLDFNPNPKQSHFSGNVISWKKHIHSKMINYINDS